MAAGDFQVVEGGHQVPVQAIVFVLAPVGVLDDAEDLALAVGLFHRRLGGGLLPVVLSLLLGERVLLAGLVRQHGLLVELAQALKAQVAIDGRGRAQPHFALLPEPEVVEAALAAADAQNQPREQANHDQGLNCTPFFLPE